ncbi:MAG: hypothetical protein ACK4EX_00980 [Thermaurantimonas sp.]|uniref:hypothetical protein n=1 Tax=Thermaurantimonas sp. TaxID=2681568 RepID=UPI00391A4426
MGVPLTSFASLSRSGRCAPGYASLPCYGFAPLRLRTALSRALRIPHAREEIVRNSNVFLLAAISSVAH